MATVLGSLSRDVTDVKAWMQGLKAAGGGAVGILAMEQIDARGLSKIGFLNSKPMLKQGVKAALGVGLGVVGERYVGSEMACGFIGGVSGLALARVVNGFLPASVKAAGLGDYDVDVGALTASEREFLSDVPGEDEFNEVAVEGGEMSEVAVEGGSPFSADVEMDAEQIAGLG